MTPRDRHLRKAYGITEKDYQEMLKRQGGVCFICGNPRKTRSLAVDHEHVKGYKKMPPEEKRKYVRGLLCFTCNWIMCSRGVSLAKAKKLVEYLTNYEQLRRARLAGTHR